MNRTEAVVKAVAVAALISCSMTVRAACAEFGGFGDGECTGPIAELSIFPGDNRLYIRLRDSSTTDACPNSAGTGPNGYIVMARSSANFADLYQMLLLATATQQTVVLPTLDVGGANGCQAKGGVRLLP